MDEGAVPRNIVRTPSAAATKNTRPPKRTRALFASYRVMQDNAGVAAARSENPPAETPPAEPAGR